MIHFSKDPGWKKLGRVLTALSRDHVDLVDFAQSLAVVQQGKMPGSKGHFKCTRICHRVKSLSSRLLEGDSLFLGYLSSSLLNLAWREVLMHDVVDTGNEGRGWTSGIPLQVHGGRKDQLYGLLTKSGIRAPQRSWLS